MTGMEVVDYLYFHLLDGFISGFMGQLHILILLVFQLFFYKFLHWEQAILLSQEKPSIVDLDEGVWIFR
jgi:hypothetical protein